MAAALIATVVAAAIAYWCASVLVRPFTDRRARRGRLAPARMMFAAILCAVTLAGYPRFGILSEASTRGRMAAVLCGAIVLAALIAGGRPARARQGGPDGQQ